MKRLQLNKIIYIGFLILTLINLISCRSAQVGGFKDPEFEKFKPKKILLFVNINNITQRVNLENEAEHFFSDYDLKIIKSHLLVPPTRSFTNAEVKNISKNNNIDTILEIKITAFETSNEGSTEALMPSSNMAVTSTAIRSKASFITILYEPSTSKRIWISNYKISRSENVMRKSLKTLVKNLEKNNLIIKYNNVESPHIVKPENNTQIKI